MADFLKAYERTAEQEGGYANDPADRGGETYKGIARKFHPHWHGWAIVDAIPNKKRGQTFPGSLLSGHVKDFYRSSFWNKMGGDKIQSQRVAEFIYDWYVNSGAGGLKKVQAAVGVTADGQIGPKSIAAINAIDEAELMDKLICARLAFVSAIVAANPSQSKFLKGWNNRINSFR